ncbi:MAG TPA: hypothetical protein VM238_07165 [Phycisphaerae bacterium]|nr:hypothetical protein [Phycisphaerae bacterium]
MRPRETEVIDSRIARLQALLKRLRAERRLSVLAEKHQKALKKPENRRPG